MTEWIVTSSALILVVIALRGLLNQRLRPMVRYALWALVLVRLLVPFSFFQSSMSLGNVAQDIGKEAGAAVIQYETKYDQVVQQYAQMGVTVPPAQVRDEAREQVYADTYQSISDRYAQAGVSVPEVQIQQEARAQTNAIDILAMVTEALPVIWYAGMALMVLALLGSNVWFAWKLRSGSTPIPLPGFPLPVYETHYAATPCLFGLIRPGVYLTPEAAADSVMRRHVLAHELTHHRHGDHIWSVLRGVCLVLHWYNPLVWAAALLSKQDAELACDEATIRALGEAERTAYGKTLIGMTCIRHDPKTFLVTATTMTGTKNTLKERVRSIARKPKNALYAVVACVLVVSLAVGCTFSGAATDLTRDEAWERVLAAVEAYNNRDHYHITVESSYDFSDDSADGSLVNEFYQADGNELCRTTVGDLTEVVLRYGGSLFASVDGEEWNSLGETRHTTDLSFEIPDEENLVISWRQDGPHLYVICDYSYEVPDEYAHMDPTVTFTINEDGSLFDYSYRYGVDQENSNDYIHSVSVRVHDDSAMGTARWIHQAYDVVAATLGLDTVDPVPTPTGYPGDQLQRSLIWYEGRVYIDIAEVPGESVPDRYLFSGFITHEDPTTVPEENFHACHIAIGTDVYADPDDSRYIYYWEHPHEEYKPRRMQRLDLSGLTIYDVTGEPPTEPTTEPQTEPVTEPIETQPTVPAETIALPGNYTLPDVVITRTETIPWTDSNGNTQTIQYHIPMITPFSEDAVLLQNVIDSLLVTAYEENLSYSTDARYEPHQFGSTFEASLNDGVLSLLIQTPTDYGTSLYAYNLDTVSGNMLDTVDMVARYMPDISYPQFLSAVVRMQEALFRQTHNSSVYYLSTLPSENTYVLNDTWLYLDGNGDLCVLFHAYHLGGGESNEQTTPLNSGDIVWEPPSLADAYGWLFNIDIDQAHMEAAYASLLFQAFYANPEEFVQYFGLSDMEALSGIMGNHIQDYSPETFEATLKDLRENGNLSQGEHTRLDYLFEILP